MITNLNDFNDFLKKSNTSEKVEQPKLPTINEESDNVDTDEEIFENELDKILAIGRK